MSKLDELIAQLCPDGVEYKELQEVLRIRNGGDYKSFGEGEYPVYGSGGIMTYVDRYIYDKPSVLIPRKGSIDKLYYVDTPFWNVDTVFYTEIDESMVLPRFVYHYLLREHLEKLNTAGGVPSLTQKVLNRVKIPVPPKEVQREIVHILDEFTLLSAELSAELSARRKQYEYYRDKLLTFGNNVVWKTLGDIGKVSMCKRIMKEETSSEGDIPFYKIGTFGGKANAFISKKTFERYKSQYSYPKKGEILISAAGTIGRTVVFDGEPAYFQDSNIVWLANDETQVLNRFLYYWYQTSPWKVSTGGTIARLYNDNIAGAKVPVMPIEIQERLVHVLNNFDAVCNDLNIGLPAEIEARQKQYEYYRDLLLTFATTGDSILTDRQTDRQAEIRLLQYVFGYAYVGLEDISQNCDAQRKPVAKGSRVSGKYPYYGASGIVDYVEDYVFDGDYLLISEDGANLVARVTPIAFSITGKTWVNNHAHVLKFEDWHEQKYVEIYLNGMDLNKYISGAAQPKLNQQNLNSIRIPMPDREEVVRIVDILERFDKICNDITEGLPAEMDARQKQYEYYRNFLLTFKEKK